MTKSINIDGTEVKPGDYVSFKKEEMHPSDPGSSILDWKAYTYKYSGRVDTFSDNGDMIRLVSSSGDAGWVTITDIITVIEHRPCRKVGWWELRLAHIDSPDIFYWNGEFWLEPPNGYKVAVDKYQITKEHYVGPSGIDSV